MTVYVDPKVGIRTSGKVATLDDAKAQFEAAWRQLPELGELGEM